MFQFRNGAGALGRRPAGVYPLVIAACAALCVALAAWATAGKRIAASMTTVATGTYKVAANSGQRVNGWLARGAEISFAGTGVTGVSCLVCRNDEPTVASDCPVSLTNAATQTNQHASYVLDPPWMLIPDAGSEYMVPVACATYGATGTAQVNLYVEPLGAP